MPLRLVKDDAPVERGAVDTAELRELLAEANIRTVFDFDPRLDAHVNAAVALLLAGPALLDACDAYSASRPSGAHRIRRER